MTEILTNSVIISHKIQCLIMLSKALKYEIDWVNKRNNPKVVTPSIHDYSLAATAPKALTILGCSLSRYLDLFQFILDDLDLAISGGYVVDVKTQDPVSHTALLKLVNVLTMQYRTELVKSK